MSLDAEQAIPLGLIASEVLTNALRHAFSPGEAGAVSVTLVQSQDGIAMVIADSGKGLPASPRRSGLGSSMIAALARQIGATVGTDSSPGKGVSVTVRLSLVSAVRSGASQAAGSAVPIEAAPSKADR